MGPTLRPAQVKISAMRGEGMRRIAMTMEVSDEVSEKELDDLIANKDYTHIVANMATGINAVWVANPEDDDEEDEEN
jgi:hypothetical protein